MTQHAKHVARIVVYVTLRAKTAFFPTRSFHNFIVIRSCAKVKLWFTTKYKCSATTTHTGYVINYGNGNGSAIMLCIWLFGGILQIVLCIM